MYLKTNQLYLNISVEVFCYKNFEKKLLWNSFNLIALKIDFKI